MNMRGRPNLIDTHPERKEIIAAILAKTPIPQIAAKYGVSDYALYRYKQKDLPDSVLKATAALVGRQLSKQRQEEAKDLDPFIDTALRLQNRLEKIADKAESDSDWKATVMSLREARETNKYQAELAGRLNAPGSGSDPKVIIIPMIGMPPVAAQPIQAQDVEFRSLGPTEDTPK